MCCESWGGAPEVKTAYINWGPSSQASKPTGVRSFANHSAKTTPPHKNLPLTQTLPPPKPSTKQGLNGPSAFQGLATANVTLDALLQSFLFIPL